MSNILITGGTSNLGKSLVKLLTDLDIEHTIGSRKNTSGSKNIVIMDLLENKGIKAAVQGKDIIFHLATDMKKDTQVTENLLKAIGTNRDIHLVYSSVVGIDKVPLGYYKQKLASEDAIKKSGIPFTILRATQFHQFINQIISTLLKFPIGLLPKRVISQPIQTELVAAELYRLALEKRFGKTYEIGGAEVSTLEQMAHEWMQKTGKKRWIINLPLWGALGKTLKDGSLTTEKKQPDSLRWRQWLNKQSDFR